ncbi:binding-protein-dependent transport systems inner membrane component [Dinoroseobacter shibae DFL 12 = DSM 16493]|jgi:peptide/nickel transport system permease protein|uniref:Binding-protein-dependent transport systems inner membrane component n=1 Tax=Dinoroseobacter shibae (strain DSM 16493 / NCIMB 14021 / DFL 12) TaxID=398580 RepID=A8LK32_DINSH|nr:ABC transporter permease [Dinoroseobacter shibae]ABV93231.1 binding-protein-dependent transport systems inner membrane component [Dinoroseobacter shibae DFL 12 = DSM 16493]URF48151.1 ABC transporter permease [Dinoroseobacter shibae]URF52461.1 ABC transporter permease [Dinoroseobacter shibae]
MFAFILRRFGVMALTALCVTFIVFFMTNLQPNLEKVAKSEGSVRMTDAEVASWLSNNGYDRPMLVRYGEWLGLVPGWTRTLEDGGMRGRCIDGIWRSGDPEPPGFCGLLQGDFGTSTVFKADVGGVIAERLALTGKLMFWVMVVMVPSALLVGVLAGMREGSRTDRTLSTASIITTATPEYVSGVVLVVLFASSTAGLSPLFAEWGWIDGRTILKGSAASAAEDATLENFTLPVLTMALYGMGYIARMTRASMAEVMTAQYIRTARLKGVSFRNIVLKHALRNALIAPFTVIMLQFPWLLTGVVIVETLFNYKGFGWTLVQAASNNDVELLLSCSVVAVIVVLVTQLISDIGYVFLNPRIRIA